MWQFWQRQFWQRQFWRRIPAEQQSILSALAKGATLKVHRAMDGAKVHRLHMLNQDTIEVPESIVNALKRRKLIDSNMKFPAATYLLTDKGRRTLKRLADTDILPLSAHNYHRE